MLKFAARTDKGLIREINEDSYEIVTGIDGSPLAFIIADGMGGHNAGEVASKAAVDFISARINGIIGLNEDGGDISGKLKDLLQEANEAVLGKSMERLSNSGMGTTLTAAILYRSKMFIGHAGDSRAYIIRNGKIDRITTDHSYIEELVKNGSITREEALNHPKKHVITKALGCMERLEADTYVCEIHENDIFILCTDGLTNMVSEEQIGKTAVGYEPQQACDQLVKTANANGGDDNITVIVIKNG